MMEAVHHLRAGEFKFYSESLSEKFEMQFNFGLTPALTPALSPPAYAALRRGKPRWLRRSEA
jgi:hypothetical protein